MCRACRAGSRSAYASRQAAHLLRVVPGELQGLRDGAGDATPPLEAHAGGPLRAKEFASSADARGPLDP